MPTRWLRVGGLEFQGIPEIPNLIAPGVRFAHESHSVRPAFAMLCGKKSMSDFSPAFQGVEGSCFFILLRVEMLISNGNQTNHATDNRRSTSSGAFSSQVRLQ